MIQYVCDRCGQKILPPQPRFTLKVELYAAKEDLYFTEADFKKDLRAEMDALIKQMEKMDAEQLTDEVYTRYEFDVCAHCRKRIYTQLRRQLPLDFLPVETI